MFRQLSMKIVCIVYSMFSLALVKLRLAAAFVEQCLDCVFIFFVGTCYAKCSLFSMKIVCIVCSTFSLALVML